jgi:hypothetical protein
VIWLVFWSFVITLTPVALGLSWKLISGIGRLIGLGLSRAFEGAERWRSLHPLSFDPPSSPVLMAGRTPCPGAGRSLAPDRRVPSEAARRPRYSYQNRISP